MARFSWGAMIKAVLATALVTSVLWLGGGLAYFRPAAPPQTAPGPPQQARAISLLGERPPPPRQSPARQLAMPVSGIDPAALVDTFTQARLGGRVHDAIDIMAPRGTPVVAAAPGTAEKLFNSALGGFTVYLRSPDRRLIYYYAHLDGYAPGLAEGRRLRTGDPVGFVGSTGNADPAAPHLHFAVLETEPAAKWYQPAIAMNPYPLLTGRR